MLKVLKIKNMFFNWLANLYTVVTVININVYGIDMCNEVNAE